MEPLPVGAWLVLSHMLWLLYCTEFKNLFLLPRNYPEHEGNSVRTQLKAPQLALEWESAESE